MKKLLIPIFCMIFLIGNVSALEFDNWVSYDKNDVGVSDMKVKVSNLFGLGKDYVDLELKSHKTPDEIKQVGIGKQVVMWYNFYGYELYKNGLGKVKFIDMNTGEEVERDYSFVYLGEKEKNVYGCKYSYSANKTEICEEVVVGTKTYEAWLPYNSRDIPIGKKTIGIRVEVLSDDYIDGIWTITGKELKKHAEWTASLNAGLLSYYKFDEQDVTGAGTIIDSVSGLYNGTNNGADNTTGKINTAYDFVETNSDWINVSDLDTGLNGDFTINFWFYNKGRTGWDLVVGHRDATNNILQVGLRTTGAIHFYFSGSDGGESDVIYTSYVASEDTWYMGTAVYNGTHASLWVNGSLYGKVLHSADLNWGTDDFLEIGAELGETGDALFNGTIDEVAIWSKALNSAEINQLWNSGAGIQYAPSGSTNLVILNSPTDASSDNNRTQVFNYTPTFYLGKIKGCGLFTNETSWSLKTSNSSVITNGTWNTLTDAFGSDGTFLWNIRCQNSTSDVWATNNYTININSAPEINIQNPGNDTYHSPIISFNATSDLEVDNWIVNYNGTNHTISINSSLVVEDGNHHLLLYGRNAITGIYGLNDTIYFTVDTSPTISVFSPSDQNYSTSKIWFNATANLSVDSWKVDYNGTNHTISINSSLTVEDGDFNLNFWARNSVTGMWGLNDSISFNVDATAPTLNITHPLNETYTDNYTTIDNTRISVNFTQSDPHIDACWFYNLSSSANETVVCGNNITYTNLTYGSYTQYYYVNDTYGNLGISKRSFIVTYKIRETERGYDSEILELSLGTFRLNITTDGTQSASAIFIYNKTSYTTTKSSSGNDVKFVTSIYIPSIVAETNITFYWNITYGSEIISTIFSNQTIKVINLSKCVAGTKFLTLNVKDEETESFLDVGNTTIKFYFNYYTNNPNYHKTVNGTYSTNNISFCLDPADEEIKIEGEIFYTSNSYVDEYHYILGDTFTNSTTIINLFDLLSSSSISFVVYLYDSSSVAVENTYMNMKKKDIGTSVYKVVEMSKTDDFGMSILHFVTEDDIYMIEFYDGNGNLLYSTNEFKAACLETVCTLEFKLPFSQETDPFSGLTYDENFNYYTNLSNGVIYFIYNSINGTAYDLRFEVAGLNIINDTLPICSETEDNVISGTLTCNVSSSIFDTFLTRAWINGELEISEYIEEQDDTWKSYGTEGVIYTVLIVAGLTALFAWHWALAMMGSVAGLLISLLFRFIPGSIASFAYIIVVLVYLIIIGSGKKQ